MSTQPFYKSGGLWNKLSNLVGNKSSGQQYSSGGLSSSQPINYTISPLTGPVLGASTSFIGPQKPIGPQLTNNQQPNNQQPNNQQPNDIFGNAADLANEQAQNELRSALSEFDQYSEQGNLQKNELGTQQNTLLSGLENQQGQVVNESGNMINEAGQATTTAKQKDLSTAQDVTKKNRNVLRALGILSSSAAGEMLNRPQEEYATQAADLEQQFVKRKSQVEQWAAEKKNEITSKVTEVKQNFQNMIAKIDSDLRFNERQRAEAVRAAGTALKQTMESLRTQALSYQQAADQYNSNILAQVAQLKLYQNPQADTTGIQNQLLSTMKGGNSQSEMSSLQTKKNVDIYGNPI